MRHLLALVMCSLISTSALAANARRDVARSPHPAAGSAPHRIVARRHGAFRHLPRARESDRGQQPVRLCVAQPDHEGQPRRQADVDDPLRRVSVRARDDQYRTESRSDDRHDCARAAPRGGSAGRRERQSISAACRSSTSASAGRVIRAPTPVGKRWRRRKPDSVCVASCCRQRLKGRRHTRRRSRNRDVRVGSCYAVTGKRAHFRPPLGSIPSACTRTTTDSSSRRSA